MALVEYTMSPNWFFAIQDLYNYGNDDQKNHYFNFNFGYIKGSNRIEIGYGKRKEPAFFVLEEFAKKYHLQMALV